MTTVARPIDDTYEDVKKLISHIVTSFYRNYGGDWDEMFAESNIVFMNVYKAFDPSRGSFNSVLGTSIENRLKDLMFHNARRKTWSLDQDSSSGGKGFGKNRAAGCGSIDSHKMTLAADIPDRPDCTFHLEQFAENLSKDAITVLKLILDSPAELAAMAEAKGGTPRNWRSTVREYLANLHWHASRIAESFSEIQEVLQES